MSANAIHWAKWTVALCKWHWVTWTHSFWFLEMALAQVGSQASDIPDWTIWETQDPRLKKMLRLRCGWMGLQKSEISLNLVNGTEKWMLPKYISVFAQQQSWIEIEVHSQFLTQGAWDISRYWISLSICDPHMSHPSLIESLNAWTT